MFIADTSKTSEKECLQVNYNKWTNNFKDERRSVKVCEILKLVAKHGLSKSDSTAMLRGDSMIVTFHVPPLASGQGPCNLGSL